jgi:drug/metabolite transporter (DMT)-like permease
VSPAWIVAIRTGVGGAVLVVLLRVRGRPWPRGATMWRHLLVLAVLGNAVPWGAVAWAQQSIPSGLSAVVNSLVPLSTLVVAAAVGVERLSVRRVFGLLAALAGTAVVVAGEVGAPERTVAVIVVAAATLLYGSTAVYAKRYVSDRLPALSVAAGQVLLACVVTLPVAAVLGPTPRVTALSAGAVWSLLALGAVGTGLAFLLFYLLIERVGATSTTMVTYLIPVVGVAAGWLLLGERLGPNVLVGAVLILVGVTLAQRQRVADEPAAAPRG